jgi:hypothetical protein
MGIVFLPYPTANLQKVQKESFNTCELLLKAIDGRDEAEAEACMSQFMSELQKRLRALPKAA